MATESMALARSEIFVECKPVQAERGNDRGAAGSKPLPPETFAPRRCLPCHCHCHCHDKRCRTSTPGQDPDGAIHWHQRVYIRY
uniref:Uncharacterized protein n=1 Tax=Hordeum vulgare subsp. vulgare TaxID=112509 RepID=A0A023IN92_HORVV|nr:hypothetical protein [Hordeum vulgare subsp. vulgare]